MRRDGVSRAVFVELADAGPDDDGADQRNHTTLHMNDRGTGEVRIAVAEAEIHTQHSQPAAAPDPVTEHGIHDGPNRRSVKAEGRPFPAFRHGARGNGSRGIHKHHLEQEKGENPNVISGACQEVPSVTEDSKWLAENGPSNFIAEARITTQCRQSTQPAEHEGETANVKAQHAERIDHEIHGHGVVHVFGAGHARFHHGEPGLHEHDEEARDQGPHDVDGHSVMPNRRG